MGQYKDKKYGYWIYSFQYKKYTYAARGFQSKQAAKQAEAERRKAISLGIGLKSANSGNILKPEITTKYKALKDKYLTRLENPQFTLADLFEEIMNDFDLPYKFQDIAIIVNNKRKKNVKVSAKLRLQIFERDNFTCRVCGAKPPDAVINCDHIVPVSKGGLTEWRNLRTLCRSCNIGRSNSYIAVNG